MNETNLELCQLALCLSGRHPVLVCLLLLRGHGGLEAPLLVLQLGPDDPHLKTIMTVTTVTKQKYFGLRISYEVS